MDGSALLHALIRLPRLGWVDRESPLTVLPSLGKRLGLESLTVKRDDLLEALLGGTKPRKLEYLLAERPFADSARWASVGAIGSGHLVATTAAATRLGRALDVHCFWEPLTAGVLDNLAFTAVGPTRLCYHSSRVRLALSHPGLFLRSASHEVPVIPPGGSLPAGVAGLVRAGLELGEAVRRHELPEPDRLYVALGTGGTAVGLAIGCGLAGLRTRVHAVATVERVLSPKRKLGALTRAALRWLEAAGVPGAGSARAAEIVIDRSELGGGYGEATAQSLAACELFAGEGVDLEPIYTGKAAAALLADANSHRGIGHVLFWHTARRRLARPEGWVEKLPPMLARRLEQIGRGDRFGRRKLVVGGAALAGAAAVAVRLSGYPDIPGWNGRVLSEMEAAILAAAAEAVLPAAAKGPRPMTVAANVDRFLLSFGPKARAEVHGLLGLVEHGPLPLGARLPRFTRLPVEGRAAFLDGLAARGGLLAQVYRGVRDLCFLGYYQDPESWKALGYPGPWGPAAVPFEVDYDGLRARPGQRPTGAKT